MKQLQLRGAVFDLDGVITKTAHIHAGAWEEAFNRFLREYGKEQNKEYEPFDPDKDYLNLVDGKPRYDGVRDFLASRGITLPEGTPEDGPGKQTVCGLGNAKNQHFRAIIDREGAEIFESSVKLVRQLKERGVKLAVASSSKNCQYILESTGLIDLFEAVIGGLKAKQIGLRGKPAPDIFITAADRIGVYPGECIMFEDALSGVEAGRNGNFGMVIGVARHISREKLLAHGADRAVDDLEQLTLDEINNWFAEGIDEDNRYLTFHGFDAGMEKLRETLTTTGNGYFATRGSLETEQQDDDVHYPGTYMAGLFNKTPSQVHGKTIWNNDLVNLPNWLLTRIRIADGPWYKLHEMKIHRYCHRLSFMDGTLYREIDIEDNAGNRSLLEIKRFVSMADCHYGALQLKLTPLNWSAPVTIDAAVDGNITNNGVPRYRALNGEHLVFMDAGETRNGYCLFTKTNYSNIAVFIHAKTELRNGNSDCSGQRSTIREEKLISHRYTVNAVQQQPLTLEKSVFITTGNSVDPVKPQDACFAAFDNGTGFTQLYNAHAAAWVKLWEHTDIVLTGDRFVQRTARLHIYHLLVTASPHNVDIDAGLPARGLHGEAYRGHIFWDSLFVLPFYSLHFPEITRSLLLYHYRRLDKAREYAAQNGARGAMFPWQTADSGEEETQEIHYNPVSDKWDPDLSRNQRHVSIAIFYNILNYFQYTRDAKFMEEYGAEMVIEIARCWTSITEHDKENDSYHIRGVMGPDEFHEKYPDREKAGLDDNAYTNVMVCWLLQQSIELLSNLPKERRNLLFKKLKFDKRETEQWREIARKLSVEWTEDGILNQFAGYAQLQELDWDSYREKYGDIHRLDRILKSEDDTPDRYKIAKQADTLMLFYLLPPWDVVDCLHYMENSITDTGEFVHKLYEYYIDRTTHGSTLSRVVHGSILKYMRDYFEEMYDHFLFAMESDIYDTQGGTTEEGIHAGVMGGTLDILISNFAGIMIRKHCVTINPRLPYHWQQVALRLNYRHNLLQFTVTQDTITAELLDGPAPSVQVQCGDDTRDLKNGEQIQFTHDNWGAISLSR